MFFKIFENIEENDRRPTKTVFDVCSKIIINNFLVPSVWRIVFGKVAAESERLYSPYVRPASEYKSRKR